MQRVVETADIILDYLSGAPYSTDPILVEGPPYPTEPNPSLWKPDMENLAIENLRIVVAFRCYFCGAKPSQTEDSVDILVCHGNNIRYFVCRALQIIPKAWIRMTVAHCSLTMITIKPNGVIYLSILGDTGFMPRNMITI